MRRVVAREEGRGWELEVYFYSLGVDELHPALFFREGVVTEKPGPADGDLWVHVPLEAIDYIFRGQVLAVLPLDIIAEAECKSLAPVADVPAGAQVADHLAEILTVVLDHLVVKLGVGYDTG